MKLDLAPALNRYAFLEFLHQTGFSDSWLSTQQHDLAGAVFGLLPTVEQGFQRLLAANQGRQTVPNRHPKAVPHPALGYDLIGLDRPRSGRSPAPATPQPLNQAGGRPADDNRIGPGQVLEARCDIRRLA